jgi:CheY-like chemotaxis protein
VLDVMMPGLDGFELAVRLRRHDRTRSIPLLFLSAESAPANELRARPLGALASSALLRTLGIHSSP